VLSRLSKLTASTRLKVNRDTFFIPDQNGGVYFRNNLSSFRMEGSSIYQWIEKLMPMFNGDYSLESLTNGLPEQYRERVYEIGEVLYKNGFARDVSKDQPHQLKENILKKYASQIEFLNSFGESGAYRFQTYRQANILAVGSGAFFVSLVSALLESGLSKIYLLITDTLTTNQKRINELVENAKKTDSEIEVEVVNLKNRNRNSWSKIIESFDGVLYVTEENDVAELKILNSICKEEKKRFIPAICSNEIGMAGPLVNSNSVGCFESAWKSIHEGMFYKDDKLQPFSSIAAAMLANIIVFELFKDMTKSNESENKDQFYLINLETLEGNWHTFVPHPLVTGRAKAELVQNFDQRIDQNFSKGEQSNLYHYLGELTSEESGIFHIWDEGELKQLPLAQCRIQVVDPLSQGPAKLLSSKICADLTHEEARREAALLGIEMYAAQLADSLVKNIDSLSIEEQRRLVESIESISIGTGETFAECICRGLQKCLANQLNKQKVNSVSEVKLIEIEDERCQFYLQSLKTIDGEPKICLGKEVLGFPVVWVASNGRWYKSVGLNKTLALRGALQKVLFEKQNQTANPIQTIEASSIFIEEKKPIELIIPACSGMKDLSLLKEAMINLKKNNMQLLTIELMIEPFKIEELNGIFGVMLREVQSS
jgi:putative thiazole-containing bacteriocin maturation protein